MNRIYIKAKTVCSSFHTPGKLTQVAKYAHSLAFEANHSDPNISELRTTLSQKNTY